MEQEKSQAELLKEQLFMQRKNGGLILDESQLKQADDFCEEYKNFLNRAKTEREAVDYAIEKAEQNGFVPFDPSVTYTAGQKVYYNNRNKSIVLAVMGTEPLENGVRLIAVHIDSPRLDLKPNPLYEDHEVALFKTHYYGGIKKYQWTTIPLSLHGVILKQDGSAGQSRKGC